MKRTQLVISLFHAAAFAVTVGCKPQTDVPVAGETSRDAAAQLDRAKKETKEAIDATRDYAYAQRADYAAKIRAELAELNKEIDRLSAKAESSSASARAEAKGKLQEVREKLARLSEKLDGVPSATESTWEDVKSGVRKGYDEVKDAFDQARRWVSEKIAS